MNRIGPTKLGPNDPGMVNCMVYARPDDGPVLLYGEDGTWQVRLDSYVIVPIERVTPEMIAHFNKGTP